MPIWLEQWVVVTVPHRVLADPTDMELDQSLPSSGAYWTDIDAVDHDDPMACTEYVHDIVRHLLKTEVSLPNLHCRFSILSSHAEAGSKIFCFRKIEQPAKMLSSSPESIELTAVSSAQMGMTHALNAAGSAAQYSQLQLAIVCVMHQCACSARLMRREPGGPAWTTSKQCSRM